MTRSELHTRMAEIASSVFEQPTSRFTDAIRASDIRQWDSLNHIKLLVAIEEEFDLRFGNADLQDPQNWGEFVDMVHRKLTAKAVA